MKSLFEYLNINVKQTKIVPNNGQELMKIVHNEIKRLGFTGNFNHIDVSNVTCFDNIFYSYPEYTYFNGDISEWNVSKMKSCKFMFSCTQFDGDLSQWDVSNCEDFNSMFNTTSHFTGKGLENWNIRNAKTTEYMFHKTYSFDGESIVDWKLPNKIESIKCMFKNALALTADLSKWNVSKIALKNKSQMFDHAFNMTVEHLPKGLNPNLVNFDKDADAEAELRKQYNKSEKENLI